MSSQVTLRAETGRPTGSRESRRLRRTGRVPAIVYGKAIDPIAVAFEKEEAFLTHLDAIEPVHAVVEIARQHRGKLPMAVASGGGQNVGWIAPGDWLAYANVDFGSPTAISVTTRRASGATACARTPASSSPRSRRITA